MEYKLVSFNVDNQYIAQSLTYWSNPLNGGWRVITVHVDDGYIVYTLGREMR